jgi:hypothetical protein
MKRKEWPEKALATALRDVWNIKEALRVTLRKEWLESMDKKLLGLAKGRHGRLNRRAA